MDRVLEQIHEFRLVPVVAIQDAGDAAPLADALIEGGLPCAEITFRTDAAEQSIRTMAASSKMLVGAGTVLSVDQVRQAVDAGARFIVSPGFNPEVVEYCVQHAIPVTPGTATPTDIEKAMRMGLEVVKFFPAEAFGGLKTLKAISAPYTQMRFIPTGGIHQDNLADYLQFPKVFACGGSWMVKSNLIAEGHFDEIIRRTQRAVERVQEIKDTMA
jgi:2-dehydro-3-deoxyphosphogluconate aldolase/(4S)-4-hydroxy-2-oxoglutarate aldolase